MCAGDMASQVHAAFEGFGSAAGLLQLWLDPPSAHARTSAPVLLELDAGRCRLWNMEGGPSHAALPVLLPALAGASRLRRLDLSNDAALPEPHQLALAPLAAMGVAQLTELVLQGCPVGAFGLGTLLQGLTCLRRLDVSNLARAGGGAGAAPSGGGFDDACLAALAGCGLSLLEDLDASGTAVEGLFVGWDGGGRGGRGGSGAADPGSGDEPGGGPPPSPWSTLRGLRTLRLAGSGLTTKPAAVALAAALGSRLTSLSIGRAEGGCALAMPALAALCARMPALRELRLVGGDYAPRDLEAHLPRLPSVEAIVLEAQSPLICDAARLLPLAKRLRRARVSINGVAVEASAVGEGPGGAPSPAAAAPWRRSSSSAGGGGRGQQLLGASPPAHGAPAGSRIDQRFKYSPSFLESLRSSPAVAAAAERVRGALLAADGSEGGAPRRGSEVLRPDW
jgi:hypothetical protein